MATEPMKSGADDTINVEIPHDDSSGDREVRNKPFYGIAIDCLRMAERQLWPGRGERGERVVPYKYLQILGHLHDMRNGG